jgi:hypothetical protein
MLAEYMKGILGASGVVASLAVVVIGQIKVSPSPTKRKQRPHLLVVSIFCGIAAIVSALSYLAGVPEQVVFGSLAVLFFGAQLLLFLLASIPFWLDAGKA